MSLYGMMRTGVSGMNAQANRLSTVADNIANSDTTGYKRSSAEFSTLIMPSTGGAYNSGGVTTTIRSAVSSQGVLQYTTSVSDLAVNGDGFFVVQDPSGTPYLTRAGAFVPDAQGRLVNAAGYQLMAYSYANGDPAATANGFEGLVPVQISDQEMTATPSTEGTFTGNLPAGATAVTAG
ncbi:MAG: flagellar hook-basal body complex protein, partial [Mesorhizobium sp.]